MKVNTIKVVISKEKYKNFILQEKSEFSDESVEILNRAEKKEVGEIVGKLDKEITVKYADGFRCKIEASCLGSIVVEIKG